MANVSSSNSLGENVPKLRFPEFEGEWNSSSMGELGTFTKGAPLSKGDITETGTPLILYGELYTTYGDVANTIVRKTDKDVKSECYSILGDVIIPTSGESPEEISTCTCVMQDGVILAGDLNIYRTDDVDGRFLSYEINHIRNREIAKIAQGKSIVHIKADELAKIVIRFPSKTEQLKIIELFSCLDRKIKLQKKLIEFLKLYKRGLLSKLFPQKGKSVPQYRFVGFTDAWEQRKLKDVTEFNPKSVLPDEFKYVDLESVVGTEMISYRTESKESAPSRAQRLAKTGDLFYQTVRPYQRNNYLFKKPDKNYVFSTGYAQMRPNIDAEFLMSFIQTDNFVNVVLGNCTGTSYPAINSTDLSNLEITLPKNGKEQVKIGTYFTNLDHLITLHQQMCNGTQSITKFMLRNMFV